MIRIVALCLCVFVIMASSCYAGEYVDQMNEKVLRGVKNIVSGVAEIGRGISDEVDDGIPVYNAFVGAVKGMYNTMVRVGSGAYDLVVAPIPGAKTYTPEPETLF